MTSDPVLDRISEALARFNAGDRAAGRAAFAAIWAEIETGGDPFHQCILAHYMADAQDDPLDELMWDRRALAAADRIAARTVIAGEESLAALSLYPSLHLNLADVLHRTGDHDDAARHIALARATVDGLADDGHASMIRDGIERLAQRLATAANAS